MPAVHPAAMPPLVVDLSHHNIVTDWAKVYASGIRGIVHKSTQDVRFVDPRFLQRAGGARKAGLLWGAYHFATDAPVEDQVSHFLRTVERAVGAEAMQHTLLALDWEPNTTPGQGTMSIDGARRFLELVAVRTGQTPVLYAGHLLKEELARLGLLKGDPFLAGHRLWLAHYTSAPEPILPAGFERYFLWQYTDGSPSAPKAAPIPGIESQGVDLNRYGGSAGELAAEWVVSAVPVWEEDEAVANVRARAAAAASTAVSEAPLPGPFPLPGEREQTPVAPPVMVPSAAWETEVRPEPEAPAEPTAPPAAPGMLSTARSSGSVNALLNTLMVLGAAIWGLFGWVWNWLIALLDVLPLITRDVGGSIEQGDKISKFLQIPTEKWIAISAAIVVPLIGIAVVRHTWASIELVIAKARGQAESPAP